MNKEVTIIVHYLWKSPFPKTFRTLITHTCNFVTVGAGEGAGAPPAYNASAPVQPPGL